MINKETIISVYDENLTLLQWLKSVNIALDEAVLTNVEIEQRGNATYRFVFTFEDGSTIASNDIIVAQGESIVGATITNGHLLLTLSNNDVLDAGNVKPVSSFSINNSQHLIVHYGDGTSQDLGAIFTGNINIDGNISSSGTISGAIVNGTKVTGDEIVETMPSSYVFDKSTEISGLTKEYVYAGIVKNGNKLTLILAMKLTRTDTLASQYLGLGNFVIPSSIASKIYPVNVGGNNFVDIKNVTLIYNILTSKEARAYLTKTSDGQGRNVLRVNMVLSDPSTILELNNTYYFRYEATILLSDNLASD